MSRRCPHPAGGCGDSGCGGRGGSKGCEHPGDSAMQVFRGVTQRAGDVAQRCAFYEHVQDRQIAGPSALAAASSRCGGTGGIALRPVRPFGSPQRAAGGASFVHDAVGAGDDGWDDQRGVGERRVEHDGRGGRVGFDAAADAHAVASWELVVEQDDVRRGAVEQRPDRFGAVGVADGQDPRLRGQQRVQASSDGRVVVDDGDSNRRGSVMATPGSAERGR